MSNWKPSSPLSQGSQPIRDAFFFRHPEHVPRRMKLIDDGAGFQRGSSTTVPSKLQLACLSQRINGHCVQCRASFLCLSSGIFGSCCCSCYLPGTTFGVSHNTRSHHRCSCPTQAASDDDASRSWRDQRGCLTQRGGRRGRRTHSNCPCGIRVCCASHL